MSVGLGLITPNQRLGNGFIGGRLPGIVTVAAVPASRRVLLFDKATHKVVGATGSNEDGTYAFEMIDENRVYYLTGFDHELQFNAVIRDNITPVVE